MTACSWHAPLLSSAGPDGFGWPAASGHGAAQAASTRLWFSACSLHVVLGCRSWVQEEVAQRVDNTEGTLRYFSQHRADDCE